MQTPASGSTAIWPGDWSQLIPGTISALFTGVVVALVVLGIERRRERTTARHDWERARPGVRFYVRQPFLAHENRFAAPSWAESLVRYADSLPVARWEHLLKDPLVTALSDVERVAAEMDQVGTDLTSHIAGLVARAHDRVISNRPSDRSMLIDAMTGVINAEIFDLSQENVRARFDQVNLSDRIAPWRDAVMNDPETVRMLKLWNAAVERLRRDHAVLREGLLDVQKVF